MRNRLLVTLVVECNLCAVLGVSVILGQSIQGSISGTVADPTGAVIPNATVTITDEHTTATRNATTNSSGLYSIPDLDPSTYTIKVDAKGFKTFIDTGVPLTVRQTMRFDIKLTLGTASQTVSVTGEAPVIQTDDARMDMVLDQRYMNDKPTNSSHGYGMNDDELGRKLPGAYYTRQFGVDGTALMIDGSRSTETTITVDGIKQVGGDDQYDMPTTAIEEDKVERFTIPAEYQTPASIDVTFRGGTRQYHGEYDYDFRNPKFNAGNFYAPPAKIGTPSYAMYANFGGPAYIPKLYPFKDKTFFFFTREWNKPTTTTLPLYFNMPTAGMLSGNFQGLVIGGKQVVVTDPLTGQPFSNDVIPMTRWNGVSQKILQFFPTPNTGSPNSPIRDYIANVAEFGGIGTEALRVDHNLTANQRLTFSWGHGWLPQTTDLGASGSGQIPGMYNDVSNLQTNTFALAWTFSLNPHMVNEFRLGYMRYYQTTQTGPLKLDGRGQDWLANEGITGINPGVNALAMPTISITDVQAFSGLGQSTSVYNYQTLIDNLAWQKGNHSIKFGGIWHNYEYNNLAVTADSYGSLAFDGRFTGDSWGDFLLGVDGTTSVYSPRPEIAGRRVDGGFYIQDKWAITRTINFSYGLREDFWTVPYDNRNLDFNFDAQNGALVVPNSSSLQFVNPAFPQNIPIMTAQQAGFPSRLRNLSYFNLAPRVAIAWRPFNDDKTAVRAGYGIYHDPLTFASFSPFTLGPFAVEQTFLNSFSSTTDQYGFQLPHPLPANVGPTTAGLGSIALTAVNPQASRIPYVQQWSFTIEHEIAKNTRLSTTYLGSKDTQLMWEHNINIPLPSTTSFTASRRPWPLFSNITFADNGGNQTYEALEEMVQHRWSYGFEFEGGFTWAKALNDVGDNGSDLGAAITNPFCRRCQKGPQTDVDYASFVASFVLHPPVGRGQRFLSNVSPLVNYIIGGWESANSFQFRSGEHLTPTYSGIDAAGTGITSGVPFRACNGNISAAKNFLNPVGNLSCFQLPTVDSGSFGNSGIGIIEGPGNKFWDMSIFKDFPIYERLTFRIGVQAENIFNWISFGFQNMVINSPNPFEATGSAKGMPSGRSAEFVARLTF